ncbi:DgyrCDS13577 [Dimorphilus gyrociliatus]|uniref:DgyrCDS13577 n=1 Tax=Dimorphilus gyrociliatus TaxID=2664684 RepID=A0A7I8WB42_9ANNE|nr:DgyrCDS13577 [Dimorphilus gyrociliatus]
MLSLSGRIAKRLTSSTAYSSLKDILTKELDGIREAGTWKTERVITTKQASVIKVAGTEDKILNFCANNYLGLSSHPQVVEAGKKALDSHGAGLSSVRFICGTTDLHMELEEKISKFHNREDTILYASCFDANAGFFETILTKDDAVLSDALNHASIIDGIRLCKARKYRYIHNDLEDLEEKLKESQDCRVRLIVTDGVFSMDGDVAKLDKIVQLADKYNSLVFIDECHATGFFGKTGRGTEEHFNIKVDVINSTLGKALGGAAGGYTTGKKELITLLRQRSRPYLFSNSLPPAVVASASKVFDLLMESNEIAERLSENVERFRSRMTEAGFTLSGDRCHPIASVMLGDARLSSAFADEMLNRGIYVIGFSYPVVPKGAARIRVQLSAAHSLAEVDRAIDAFIDIGKQLKVI